MHFDNRGILFDMDGVLLDSEPAAFQMFRESLESVGISMTMDELLGYVGESSQAIADDIFQNHKTTVSAEEFLKLHRSRGSFYEVSDQVKPMEGLIDFLKHVKKYQIKTAVVSSTSAVHVITALNRMEILKYFDAVICADMVEQRKPSPEGYLKACGLIKCRPDDCIVIEDSPKGIQAGKNAGIFVVGYKGSSYFQDTSAADMEIDSFQEFKNSSIINNLING